MRHAQLRTLQCFPASGAAVPQSLHLGNLARAPQQPRITLLQAVADVIVLCDWFLPRALTLCTAPTGAGCQPEALAQPQGHLPQRVGRAG